MASCARNHSSDPNKGRSDASQFAACRRGVLLMLWSSLLSLYVQITRSCLSEAAFEWRLLQLVPCSTKVQSALLFAILAALTLVPIAAYLLICSSRRRARLHVGPFDRKVSKYFFR